MLEHRPLAEAVVEVEERVQQQVGVAGEVAQRPAVLVREGGGVVDDLVLAAQRGRGEREHREDVDDDERQKQRRHHLPEVLAEHGEDVEHRRRALGDGEQVDARTGVCATERIAHDRTSGT